MSSRRDRGDRAIVVRATGPLYDPNGSLLGEPHEETPGILAGREIHPLFP